MARWVSMRNRMGLFAGVVLALSIITWAYAEKFGGHLSGLIGLSRNFSDPQKTAALFRWGAPDGSGYEGYDGQFFFELAHDPFHRHPRPESFDNLPYRSQRMLYPLLVYLASGGGRTPRVPAAMVAVNATAILAMAWGLTWLAAYYRRPRWWGLIPLATVGVLWPFTRCLAEPVAFAALTGAAVALVRHRTGWVVAGLTAACLAREQSVAVVPIFGWWMLRSSRREAAATVLIPLAAWAGWQAYVYGLYGVVPVFAITAYPILSWPGHGWGERIYLLATKGHGHCEGAEAVFLFWFLGATWWWGREVWQQRERASFGSWVVVMTLAVGWVLNIKIWEDFCSSTRTLGFLPIAMWLSDAEEPAPAKRRFLWTAAVIGLAWLVCDLR